MPYANALWHPIGLVPRTIHRDLVYVYCSTPEGIPEAQLDHVCEGLISEAGLADVLRGHDGTIETEVEVQAHLQFITHACNYGNFGLFIVLGRGGTFLYRSGKGGILRKRLSIERPIGYRLGHIFVQLSAHEKTDRRSHHYAEVRGRVQRERCCDLEVLQSLVDLGIHCKVRTTAFLAILVRYGYIVRYRLIRFGPPEGKTDLGS